MCVLVYVCVCVCVCACMLRARVCVSVCVYNVGSHVGLPVLAVLITMRVVDDRSC